MDTATGPTIIAGFAVERTLGEGATSQVVLARRPSDGRQVVVKLFMRDFTGDAPRARFDRECRTLQRLDHPNVVPMLEFGVVQDQPFLVFDYRPGETLRQKLQRGWTAAPAEACRLVARVADGLAAAHRAGIVHRDVKPENVIVTDDGTPLLIDFGLARSELMTTFRTATGVLLGTPTYMAPECFAGTAGPPADCYALGCILAELVTGRPLFAGSLDDIVAGKHGPSPPLTALPPALQTVVAGLVAPLPRRTPTDAAEVAALLEELAAAPTLPDQRSVATVAMTRRPRPSARRRSLPALLVTAVVAAVLVAARLAVPRPPVPAPVTVAVTRPAPLPPAVLAAETALMTLDDLPDGERAAAIRTVLPPIERLLAEPAPPSLRKRLRSLYVALVGRLRTDDDRRALYRFVAAEAGRSDVTTAEAVELYADGVTFLPQNGYDETAARYEHFAAAHDLVRRALRLTLTPERRAELLLQQARLLGKEAERYAPTKWNEALAILDTIDPSLLERDRRQLYFWSKGNMLGSLFRLSEAQEAMRQAHALAGPDDRRQIEEQIRSFALGKWVTGEGRRPR